MADKKIRLLVKAEVNKAIQDLNKTVKKKFSLETYFKNIHEIYSMF